jgi:deazaflavin-dependent oxidoreductase (nitroreductase family)
VIVPTDEEFLTYNQNVIEEFRTNHGVVTQPGFPILLLTTIGARTGRPRTSPLGYGIDRGKVFVIASKGGASTNPAWFHNLRANPSVRVELGRHAYEARAIVAVGEERDRLYAILSAEAPTLQGYEQSTTRRFPIVVLEGVPAPPAGSCTGSSSAVLHSSPPSAGPSMPSPPQSTPSS